MKIEKAKSLEDVLEYCTQNGVKQRTFIHKTVGMTCDYPIESELAEDIRKTVSNGPRYKKTSDGSTWKIEQYNYVGSGKEWGYACYGFSVEKITIEEESD